MTSTLRPTLVMFGALTLLCGVLYPAAVTGIGRVAFAHEADGSLVEAGGKIVGSSLIGQPFSRPGYFWGRPSATTPMSDNAAGSGGSNLGPTNPALLDAVKACASARPYRTACSTRPTRSCWWTCRPTSCSHG